MQGLCNFCTRAVPTYQHLSLSLAHVGQMRTRLYSCSHHGLEYQWYSQCSTISMKHLGQSDPPLHLGRCFLASECIGHAQNSQPAPDNTKTNQRDRAKSERTADQAKETTSDRDTMQKIRKAIMADKSLSTYGHNVKVVAEHGKVTLKGPVHTAEERSNIEAKATSVVGSGNVANHIRYGRQDYP
jgi:hyperosmotically inducible periplasmic protein